MAGISPETIHDRIMEIFAGRGVTRRDSGAILETALLIEEIFGIILSDEEICRENLVTPEAVEKLVVRKIGDM